MQAVTDLTAVLRELSKQQATGRLIVRLPGSLGSIYFKVGQIVHATLGVKKGPDALELILRGTSQRTSQSSEFRAGLAAPETTIEGSLESLLAAREPTAPITLPEVDLPEVRKTELQGGVSVAAAQPQNRTQTAQPSPPPLPTPSQTPLQPQPLQSGEVVPAGFVDDLARALVDVMGPIGNIVLEDAQADLGLADDLPKSEVQTLIAEIVRELKTPARQQPFQQKAAALIARYGLR